MTSFFVTGTDTDAGKTHVSRALLLAAREEGLTCAGYKPIESGCPRANAPGHDAIALSLAAGTAPLTTYTFVPPIAPHIAASRAHVEIKIAHIRETAQGLNRDTEFFLVEGAGGFLVPLSRTSSIADLATALAFPVLLVVANRLGAINHALLSIEAARHRSLKIAAIILSEVESGAGAGLENHETIEQFGQVPVFDLPHCNTPTQMAKAATPILQTILAANSSQP
tara:strand:+ start:6648 stop:7322 length:675 start_codon:yes stop_codon:yes gene_type:complete